MLVTPTPHQNVDTTFLMAGDSLVAGYAWQQRIPQFRIRNFGVPGATTRELLESLPWLSKQCNSARLIMVMIGTNDVYMENYAFLADLKEVVIGLNRYYPTTELLVNSLLPMQLPHLGPKAITSVNRQIELICQESGSCYIDVYSRFLQSDADLFQVDGVHLTNEGYEVWARTLLEHIAFIVESD